MDRNSNLNLYRVFYEVAKYSSISTAAKSMYLSQPAISKSIKNLETELGTTLFYRTLNGIVLTEKGKELFIYVEEAFNNIRLAEKKMLENKNLEKGTLAIGIRSHIASFYLIDKIIEYHKRYPKIEITIINRPSNELLKLLNDNKIDFIIDISSYKDELDSYDVKDLGNLEHCFVVLNNENILPNKIEYTLSDLKNAPLILPVNHSSHRKILNQFAKDNNIKFQNVLSIETSELLYDFVKRGVGVGYILKNMIINDVENGLLKIINIKEKLPKVNLKLICMEKRLTEASHRFISDYLE